MHHERLPRRRRLAGLSLVGLTGGVLLWTWGPPPAATAQQAVRPPRVVETTLDLPGGGEIRYGIAIPASYDEASEEDRPPRPLVLALHPGGRAPFYGSSFMRQMVEPALRSWEAIIVAPDVPDRRWASGGSEEAVLALLEHVLDDHVIDCSRILVTGYSMGGRGTWYFAARHPGLFTGAVPMAGSPDGASLEALDSMPVYIIHSPQDEVVPYAPAAEAAERLEELGRPVHLLRIEGAGHYQMGAYVRPLREAGAWIRQQWESAGAGPGGCPT